MRRTPLAPARWQTSPREAAPPGRPNRGRPNPRPPNRPAGTRGAGELAGRPGRQGDLKNAPYPARPRALADLPAGGSPPRAAEPGAAEPAAAESPRRDPRRRRASGSPGPTGGSEKRAVPRSPPPAGIPTRGRSPRAGGRTSRREAAPTGRPTGGRPTPRPPNPPAGTRGAGELAGRP